MRVVGLTETQQMMIKHHLPHHHHRHYQKWENMFIFIVAQGYHLQSSDSSSNSSLLPTTSLQRKVSPVKQPHYILSGKFLTIFCNATWKPSPWKALVCPCLIPSESPHSTLISDSATLRIPASRLGAPEKRGRKCICLSTRSTQRTACIGFLGLP